MNFILTRAFAFDWEVTTNSPQILPGGWKRSFELLGLEALFLEGWAQADANSIFVHSYQQVKIPWAYFLEV